MGRTIRQRLLAGVGATVALIAVPFLAYADAEIFARGWSHDSFGRLVLDRAGKLATSAEIKGHRLLIVFSEPVSVRLGDALPNLKDYINGPSIAGGRTLELTLARPMTVSQFVDEGNFVVDLRPAKSWPAGDDTSNVAVSPQPEMATTLETGAGSSPEKTEPPKTEAPKTEAPKAGASAAGKQEVAPVPNVTGAPPRIVARHGDHGTYVRLAVDWRSKINYRITRENGRIAVNFSAPAEIDLSTVERDLPKDLAQVAATNDGVARIYMTLAPGATLRDFRLGRTVVLDILKPAKKTASAPPLHLPGEGQPQKAEQKTQKTDQQAKKTEQQPPKQDQKQAQKQEAATPTLPAAPEPAPSTPATIPEPPSAAETPAQQFALQSLPAMPEAAPATQPSPPEPAPQEGQAAQPSSLTAMPAVEQATVPPRAPVDVSINVAPAENGAKIVFAWQETVAAAAFRRNGALWLVFDMPAKDVKNLLSDAQVAKLGKAAQVDVPDATIIRIAESSPLGVAMRASGHSWIVDVTQGGKDAPTATIEQRHENLADGASSLLLRTNNPGRVASIMDPSGGRLYVVPVRPAGLGIAEQAGWPEFQLLPSYQGVVIASQSDAITVDSLSQGVVVTTKPQAAPVAEAPAEGEQVASQEQAPPAEGEAGATTEKPAEPPKDGEPPKEGEPTLASVPWLFDLPTWRRGGEATFTADQRQLEGAVTSADEADKVPARLALSEFYFAHGLIAEAQDALSQIGREGRDQLDQRELALLSGAIQILDGELDKAKDSLSDKSLEGVAEANLWQGILAARQGKWPEAAKLLTEPLPNIADYPKPVREQIYIWAGTALNNAGNPVAARRFADALRLDQPDREARDRVTYLDGQISLKAGDRETAIAMWSRLSDSTVDEVRALSQFDLVNERLKGGEIKPAEAIAPLEALRFINRGGDFEFNLLRQLGTLYLAVDQPRKGLVTLRGAAANFPDRPEAKDVGEQMSKAFRELYLENGADRLTPLTAVALYDEFRELTPPGVDGDRMISMLADRLVKVDLLGRAAELLDDLVKKRLTGLDKAEAGTRLASIRMLDQKPEAALQALKGSAIDEPLPPALFAERKRLEARATFDAGDTLGGLQMLNGDDSLDAKWLRADMQWRTREWPAAATALDDLVAAEEQAMADERAALEAATDPAKNPTAAVGRADAEEALRAKQDQHFKDKIAPLLLNRAVALSLASDRRGLKALANDYGKQMEGTDQAKAFAMLTAPDNGLVESISAEMASVDRIDAFVTDYRERLKKASLGEAASGS